MAVDPNEIPVQREEVAGGSAPEEDPVPPTDTPSAPELAEGEVVPLEDFQRLEQNVSRLQQTLDARAAEAEARAEEAEHRADLALRKMEQQHVNMVRNAEVHLESLDGEDRERYKRRLEAWKASEEAELEEIRKQANPPARERRRIAREYAIPVEELGTTEDSVEMRDKALAYLKAQREEAPGPEPEPEPEPGKPKVRKRKVSPVHPPGGVPTPKPAARLTPEDIRAAGKAGKIKQVSDMQDQLKEQRKEDEKAARAGG